MKRFVVLVLLIASFTVLCFSSGQDKKDKPKQEIKIEVAEIKKYRSFFRVNETPIDMAPEAKLLCAAPTTHNPHYSPGVVYYINEISRQGLKDFATKKQFPVGSIIVKEKQEKKTDDSVKIITVMQKVKAGQEASSWEYKMYDVTKWEEIDLAKTASRSLGISSCLSCHKGYKENDYVSPRGMALMLANKKKGTSK